MNEFNQIAEFEEKQVTHRNISLVLELMKELKEQMALLKEKEMIGRQPKQKTNKYNRLKSDEFEESYCQNAACPNKNLIKTGNLIKRSHMVFCSEDCVIEVSKRVLLD